MQAAQIAIVQHRLDALIALRDMGASHARSYEAQELGREQGSSYWRQRRVAYQGLR